MDRTRLSQDMDKVNKASNHIATAHISETNKLIKPANMWVGKELGLKKMTKGEYAEPWWKRHNENNIKSIRANINILERKTGGRLKSKIRIREIERIVRTESIKLLIESIELKLKG